MRWFSCRAALLLLCGILPWAAAADADKHMGVASCAASTCHGSTRPFADARIRQDEYLLWNGQDRHAQAFATLRTDRSRRIAAKLGWKDPVGEQGCLVCHADPVPAGQHGPRYLLSDGVSCEVCHGGAERWLTPHVRGFAGAKERRASGLRPLEDLGTRAALCLGCHQGDAAHPMTHAIMGAGHPPLLFELDTFTVEMPMHHRLDADYRQRKRVRGGAAVWLTGQVQAANLLLDALIRHGEHKDLTGTFPELLLFDCNACHHPMEHPRWEPGRAGALGPGSVRLADAPLFMLGVALAAAGSDDADPWRAAVAALHDTSARGLPQAVEQARQLKTLLEIKVLPLAADHNFSALEIRRLLAALTQSGQGEAGGDFTKAEQTAMALAVLHSALAEAENRAVGKRTRAAVDELYGTVRSRNDFRPAQYRAALQQMQQLMKPLE